jgi:hypothetical protein
MEASFDNIENFLIKISVVTQRSAVSCSVWLGLPSRISKQDAITPKFAINASELGGHLNQFHRLVQRNVEADSDAVVNNPVTPNPSISRGISRVPVIPAVETGGCNQG